MATPPGKSSRAARSPLGHTPSALKRPVGRRTRLVLRLVWGILLPLAVPTVPVLAFIFYSGVRDRSLDKLGYGLIPIAVLVVYFGFALRYKRHWIKPYWRVWLGSALLTAFSIGILSLFDGAGGVTSESSLGGRWGKYLGGTHLALGILKIAALVIVSPLVLYPRRAGTIYGQASVIAFRYTKVAVNWLIQHPGRSVLDRAKRRLQRPRRVVMEPLSEASVSEALQQLSPSPSGEPAPTGVSATTTIIIPPEAPVVEPDMESEPDNRRQITEQAVGWRLPPLSILSKGESRPVSKSVLQELAQRIEEALAQHKVEVSVDDIRSGPRVIRFGLVPGWVKKVRESRGDTSQTDEAPTIEMSRVKVQSILTREKDLALALKTSYLRIEAPVPGEALVGLEVPNPEPRSVALRTVAESAAFRKIADEGGLPVAFGEDTGGEPVTADLSDLPHLLIAGATGSGKSVCINSVVASLLLTRGPDRLRMLMVDPKRVELTPFNGIPHLIAPVIVETDEVLAALRATQNEMLRRYKLLEESGVRNIEGYNRRSPNQLPFLVIIIDELADLMMSAAYEVEQAAVRLAQLGRATGIHVILATQRPSVNVVTGLLKANIPARIAFAVASQIDSRVILDTVGAEKLLGKGDMLLLSSKSPKPMRVQGTFVDDQDIQKLVEYWQTQTGPAIVDISLDDRPTPTHETEHDDDDDDGLLDRAREFAERYENLSPSVLQRRLQIGFSKAQALLEELEEEGSIRGSAGVGSEPPSAGPSPGF